MSKSLTTTSMSAGPSGMRPTHPGEILKFEFLEPLAISAYALAKAIGKPPNHVTAIINETRGITAETALLFAEFFGNTPHFWVNLQNEFEMRRARADKSLVAKLKSVAKYDRTAAMPAKRGSRAAAKGKAA